MLRATDTVMCCMSASTYRNHNSGRAWHRLTPHLSPVEKLLPPRLSHSLPSEPLCQVVRLRGMADAAEVETFYRDPAADPALFAAVLFDMDAAANTLAASTPQASFKVGPYTQ